MRPVRPAIRRAVAIVAAGVLAALLSGCSVGPVADGLERLSDNARELLGGPSGGTPSDPPSTAGPGSDDVPSGSDGDGRLRVGVQALRVGDCIGEVDPETGLVVLLPCDGPHVEEVYHEYRILEPEFPGDDRVIRIAEEECRSAFEPYLGESWEESAFSYSYWAPIEDTWIWGDRVILCTLFQPGVELGAPAGAGSLT